MKLITQKVLSLFLSLAMLLGMVQATGVTAFAADTGVTAYCNDSGLFKDSNCTQEINRSDTAYRSTITKAEIKSGTTVIKELTFDGCSGLTDITIPSSVSHISGAAFCGCSGLSQFIVDPNNSKFAAIDGVLYSHDKTILICCPAGKSGEYTILNSVAFIYGYAFSSCNHLTSIIIPNSVISIQTAAFQNCTGLTNITIPNSVISIGESAFQGCSKLTGITIPDSVSSIGNYAFASCTGLTSLTISQSVTTIGSQSFEGCRRLNNLYVVGDKIPNGIPNLPNTFLFKDNGGSYEMTGYIGTKVGIKIPTELYGKKINPAIDESKLPITSTTAYYNDTGLYKDAACTQSINNDDTYRSIITNIEFSAGIAVIGDAAFVNCKSLTGIMVPKSVSSIGNDAFYECIGLTSITIPQSVSSIGNYAFYECTGLTGITIPQSVSFIGGYAFSECTGLTSITIPQNVSSIGIGAFDKCTGLTSITIPQSVLSIGNYAFSGCIGLNDVTFQGSSIASIGDYAFEEYAVASLTFYVPIGTEDDYRNLLSGNVMGGTTAVIKTIQTPGNGGANHHSNDNSSGKTPASPTSAADTSAGATADLSGVTLPAGVTAANLSVSKKNPADKSDPQAQNFGRALLANPKAGVIGSPVIYNIELLDQNGNVTSGTGKIKITLPVPLGLRGTPHVLRYEASGTFTDMGTKLENGMLVFETDRLGYFAAAGVGDSIALDTTSYTMPVNGSYEIGLRITGTRGAFQKVYPTSSGVVKVTGLPNGNYLVTGVKTGTVWIMFDIYDSKNRLISHASVRVDVKTGIRPRGDSARQVGVF